MSHLNRFLLLLFWVLHTTSTAQAAIDVSLIVERIENGTFYLKTSKGETLKPFKTDLFDVKLFGILQSPNSKFPGAILFSANTCENCSPNPSLYLTFGQNGKPTQYVYPGKIIDPKNHATLFEGRAFFGQCIRGRAEDVYLVFQKDRVDRRRSLQPSVLIVQPGLDHLDEKLLERGFPRLDDTLRQVRKKECTEIAGRNRFMTKKTIDLKTKNANPNRSTPSMPEILPSPTPSPSIGTSVEPPTGPGEDDDEEEDAPTKENQTDKELSTSP